MFIGPDLQTLPAVLMTADSASDGIDVSYSKKVAIQAVWTGTALGSVKLQASIDNTVWFDIPYSSVPITAPGNKMWTFSELPYKYVRAYFTNTTSPTYEQQTVTFSAAPAAGTFKLKYGAVATSALAFGVTAAQMQTALRAITGLSAVTVAGDVGGPFTVTFTGVGGDLDLLTVSDNTLKDAGEEDVGVVIEESVKGMTGSMAVSYVRKGE